MELYPKLEPSCLVIGYIVSLCYSFTFPLGSDFSVFYASTWPYVDFCDTVLWSQRLWLDHPLSPGLAQFLVHGKWPVSKTWLNSALNRLITYNCNAASPQLVSHLWTTPPLLPWTNLQICCLGLICWIIAQWCK